MRQDIASTRGVQRTVLFRKGKSIRLPKNCYVWIKGTAGYNWQCVQDYCVGDVDFLCQVKTDDLHVTYVGRHVKIWIAHTGPLAGKVVPQLTMMLYPSNLMTVHWVVSKLKMN